MVSDNHPTAEHSTGGGGMDQGRDGRTEQQTACDAAHWRVSPLGAQGLALWADAALAARHDSRGGRSGVWTNPVRADLGRPQRAAQALDQMLLGGGVGGLHFVVDAQLGIEVLEVRPDGRFAEPQDDADFLAGFSPDEPV
jgi:hypothetical protein